MDLDDNVAEENSTEEYRMAQSNSIGCGPGIRDGHESLMGAPMTQTHGSVKLEPVLSWVRSQLPITHGSTGNS